MDLITTAEAGRRLGVTEQRVRQLIAAGRLAAAKIGRTHAIRPDALATLPDRKTRQAAPRPRTGKQKAKSGLG